MQDCCSHSNWRKISLSDDISEFKTLTKILVTLLFIFIMKGFKLATTCVNVETIWIREWGLFLNVLKERILNYT